MIGELALAQALLVGAGLLLVSFVHATQIDLGFATTDRVLAEINLTPVLRPAVDARRLDRSDEEDPLHQQRARSRAQRPGRARGRRVVDGSADRRAESRHAHRR